MMNNDPNAENSRNIKSLLDYAECLGILDIKPDLKDEDGVRSALEDMLMNIRRNRQYRDKVLDVLRVLNGVG